MHHPTRLLIALSAALLLSGCIFVSSHTDPSDTSQNPADSAPDAPINPPPDMSVTAPDMPDMMAEPDMTVTPPDMDVKPDMATEPADMTPSPPDMMNMEVEPDEGVEPVSCGDVTCDSGFVCISETCRESCGHSPLNTTRCTPDGAASQICMTHTSGQHIWHTTDCAPDAGCAESLGECRAHQCNEDDSKRGFVCHRTTDVAQCSLDGAWRSRGLPMPCGAESYCDINKDSFTSACVVCKHECGDAGSASHAECINPPGTSSSYRGCVTDAVTGCRTWSTGQCTGNGSRNLGCDLANNFVVSCASGLCSRTPTTCGNP